MNPKFLLAAAIIIALGSTLVVKAGQLTPPTGAITATGRFGPRTDINAMPGAGSGSVSINNPGSYYLSADLSDTIRIQTSDVTIDLNGFTVRGSGVFGIFGAPGSGGTLTVKNGTVDGFVNGVALGAGDRIRIDRVTTLNGTGQGFDLDSKPSLVTNCMAQNMGNGFRILGPTNLSNCVAEGCSNRGVSAQGNGALITQVVSRNNGAADIYCENGLVRGCVATNLTLLSGATGIDNHQP